MRLSGITVSKKTEMYMRQLYEKNEADKKIRILGRKRICLFISFVLVSAIISIPVFVADEKERTQPITQLHRNEYGKGTGIRTLRAVSDDGYEHNITVDVEERRYTDDEIRQMSEQLDNVIWETILADNTDPENVMYDLDFKDHIDGYPFSITYKSDRPLILGSRGTIDAKRLKKEDPDDEGVEVCICATAKYKDYSEDKYSYVVLHERKKGVADDFMNSINDSVEEFGKLTETEDILELPQSVNGHRIRFYDTSVNRGWMLLVTGVVAALLVMAAKDRKIKDEALGRKKQMEYDHPNILNQYTLYYTAGMNPRSIWYAMCKRYEESIGISHKNKRYAYDEMLSARNKMEEGCSELAAYDGFAARCDDIRYRSFISFVKQAVVKGNEGLSEILYSEMDKAMREKNNRVKKQASEAETKLLLPMFMMLIVVLVIVMLPAFIGLKN